jgi:hypothetical protein
MAIRGVESGKGDEEWRSRSKFVGDEVNKVHSSGELAGAVHCTQEGGAIPRAAATSLAPPASVGSPLAGRLSTVVPSASVTSLLLQHPTNITCCFFDIPPCG